MNPSRVPVLILPPLPSVLPLPPAILARYAKHLAKQRELIIPYPLTTSNKAILQEAEDLPQIYKEAVKRAKKHGKSVPSARVLNNVAIAWGYKFYNRFAWMVADCLKAEMDGFKKGQIAVHNNFRVQKRRKTAGLLW